MPIPVTREPTRHWEISLRANVLIWLVTLHMVSHFGVPWKTVCAVILQKCLEMKWGVRMGAQAFLVWESEVETPWSRMEEQPGQG